ncbi:Putative periplasmic protein YibQ, distant homology with nucleoside diphosphatase and polysaccharide deacetylase [hydrothermal vent metagenome]|uniref:Periplasmic protein YibQ, distant homology with nucleoside diphosphatase and polysaccharide deacetylase n=1 Tax=hydrothermal vent metagenome TaxID=652676 RepID=A0A3B0ZFG0_9ZZZZ
MKGILNFSNKKRQHSNAVVFLFFLGQFISYSFAAENNIATHPSFESTAQTTSIKKLRPAVSIIIDDIGDRYKDGLRAVSLPAPYTYAFLPNTPYAKKLAKKAYQMNKEVMLHLPMQAINGKKLGPNGLTNDMTRDEFYNTLQNAYDSIPHIVGMNNHMGSLLSADKEMMRWLMSFVSTKNKDLYFIDSRTSASSVIVEVAKEKNIKVLSRDTFIDHKTSIESITSQIKYLIKTAKKKGSAVGIAHPYPTTLAVLETAWPLFYEAGVDLIPVSELIKLNKKRELSEWRLSSSH